MSTLKERMAEFGGYFVLAGYPLGSAAAIVGNATRENQVLPTTTGPKDHGSDGTLQWRLGRLTELQAMPAWDTLKTQAAFTIRELQRDYKVLEAELRAGVKSLATMTANFVDVFERPSAEGRVLDERIRFATEALAVLQENHPATTPAAPVLIPTTPTTTGATTMPPLDPVLIAQLVQILAPVAESLFAGLVKTLIAQLAASNKTSPLADAATAVVHTLPSFDPAALAKLIAAELAAINPVKPA